MITPGQKVRILPPRSGCWCRDPSIIGKITTALEIKRHTRKGVPLWRVALCDPRGRTWLIPEPLLEPIDDDDASWEEIEKLTQWNPTKVLA